ncbi:MAG: cyclodeaminase/cyclohydrolase family protein [Candidatus Omnitrophica bacterium]|nr:cyclodeaminase/cyclohydrolase family protein [Candidatus Omnitrophota bacterium]
MKKFNHFTLSEYLDVLGERKPAPGGGSASALAGALGAGLIEMAANYSLGKSSSKSVEKKISLIVRKIKAVKLGLLALVDKDAEAYELVVKARQGTAAEKRVADRQSKAIPKLIMKLCCDGTILAAKLVPVGNKNLFQDVEIGVELLSAGFHGAKVLL